MGKRIVVRPGEKFAYLTFLSDTESAGKKRMARFRCDCGFIGTYQVNAVRTGGRLSCGCKTNKATTRSVIAIDGDKFGRLRFLCEIDGGRANERLARFLCDCGEEYITCLYRARDGVVNSCGCMRKINAKASRKPAPIGEKFGLLTVTSEAENHKKKRRVMARCDCGTEKNVQLHQLLEGAVSSCGCLSRTLKSERTFQSNIVSGRPDHRSRLYMIWAGMKRRCHGSGDNENTKKYRDKGISVCEEWRRDYGLFKKWSLENGYSHDLEIDRKNTLGDYTPENCRWATKVQNARNKTSTYYWFAGDVRYETCKQMAEDIGVKDCTVRNWCVNNLVHHLHGLMRREKRYLE